MSSQELLILLTTCVLGPAACLVSIVLSIELIRWTRIRQIRSRFSSDHGTISAPFISLAVTGEHACIYKYIFGSSGENIFKNRLRLADISPTYLSYKWSYYHAFQTIFTNILHCMLITSESNVARAALHDTDNWCKIRDGRGPIDSISNLACTAQNGDNSKRQRKILLYSIKNRQQHAVFINSNCSRLIQTVLERMRETPSNSLDIFPIVQNITLHLIINILFGETSTITNAIVDSFFPYWDLVRQNKHILTNEQRNQRELELQKMVQNVRVSFENAITHRRQFNTIVENVENSRGNECVLDKLIEKTIFHDDVNNKDATTNLSHEELVHNLHNFITAAFETTAHTFALTVYHISKHPQYQKSFLLQNNNFSHNDKHGNSTSVKFIIKESLRLTPPVVQIDRTSKYHSTIGGVTCPFRTTLVIDIAALHLSKSHWGNDAHVFNPCRWNQLVSIEDGNMNEANSHASADERVDASDRWIPFGAGSKSCLGQGLALQIVEVLLVEFVRAFDTSVEAGYEPKFEQTPSLRLANGLRLHIHPR